MPPLIRFMLTHAAVGFVIAVAFVAAILTLDVSGIRGLIKANDSGPLALFLLTFFCGLTFAGVQMGLAVMMMDGEDTRPGPGAKRLARAWDQLWDSMVTALSPPKSMRPAPVRVKAKRRR